MTERGATGFSDVAARPSLAAAASRKTLGLQSLSLHHFRNYISERIEVGPGPIALIGPNGAGKTNILEAISLLTPGRGLRRAPLLEIDHRDHRDSPWVIAATVTGMQGEVQIGTGRDPEATTEGAGKRTIKIDGKTARSHAELAQHLAIIWLTPQMEHLFQEGPSASRKFLDRLVYSFDPDHAARVNEYDFAMRERNKLLQSGNATDYAWIDALEATMAETSAAIAQARLHMIEHINYAIMASTLSFPKAHINLVGFMENRLRDGEKSTAAEEALRAALRDNRHHDASAGRALLGAHRSVMQIIHIEKQMVAETCSTGEQKALLLSVILAQARAGAERHGVIPVLLLDEVVAHLDPRRRLELFEEICQIGAQIWMSGADVSLFAGLEGKTQYFQIDNGRLIRD